MVKTVYVGMSGGVDSSVAAALLKRQGYKVVGVFMKNWTRDIPGYPCFWKEDFQDAKRVAVQLGIDLKVYDFEQQYRQKVVDYMLSEYQAGRTPNPDIVCNQEIKFKLFHQTALSEGADYIATGHYAKTKDGKLYMAENKDKDQTYFLYRVTETALAKTLFPIGEFKSKDEVRMLASQFGLATADKRDSQGICFVGEVGMRAFLEHELGKQIPGKIIDQTKNVIGEHGGAIFYTIGQRHGLSVGGGLPHYVIGKNMKKNEVYVTTDRSDNKLWTDRLRLTNEHFISSSHQSLACPPAQGPSLQNLQKRELERLESAIFKSGFRCMVRVRHLGPLIQGTLQITPGKFDTRSGRLQIMLSEKIRTVAPGQSAVIYDEQQVLGGGVIT